MLSTNSRLALSLQSVCFFILLLIVPTAAQIDPNPNSPAPVLLSEREISRALVTGSKDKLKGVPKSKSKAFKLNSHINLYISNVELMKGEGANAFRVYARDSKKRLYRFAVEALNRVHKRKPIYALTVKLRDEIGYWKQPSETGDLLVSVTWRGMTSNPLLLGLGKKGGLKFDPENLKTDEKEGVSPTANYVGYRWSGDRKRLLEQAAFGPTDALDQRVRRLGPRIWLEEQLNAPYPSANNPYPDLEQKPSSTSEGCPLPSDDPLDTLCRRDHYTQYLNQRWMIRGMFYGKAQLRHRVSLALSQLWVTSGDTLRQARYMVEYHKILSKNAFGNYRNLMKEMTLSPGMGDYLDMRRSSKFNPNENYAREILQLFTVGLFMLNQDGTLQLDGNGEPIPTYDQTTVNNFTKVFTGWELCNDSTSSACPSIVVGAPNYVDPMYIRNSNRHDDDAKTLLNYPNAVNRNIPEDLEGEVELDLALDNIFNHPNVAPFVSKFLIQHLVTSDPTPAYVGRISSVFNDNGSGVRGDLRAVVKAILLDPEARGDFKTDPNYGKLREPLQFMGNVYRRLNVRSSDGTEESDGYLPWMAEDMGQEPFHPPSVFNYYSPGYIVPGTSLLAPEFAILTTSTTIQRIEMSGVMAFENVEPDTRNPQNAPLGTSTDVSSYTQLMTDDPTGNRLVDELDRKFMHSTMSQTLRDNVLSAVLAVDADEQEYRARTGIFIVISSSEYQIQR